MLRDMENKANGNGQVPDADADDPIVAQRIARKAAAATKLAAAERRFQPVDDAYWIAHAKALELQRAIPESSPVRNAQGDVVVFVHPKRGRITQQQIARAERETAAAWEERASAEATLQAAQVELFNAERALQDLLGNRAYWRGQAEQEARLTPEEREKRRIRDLLDQERSAR